MNNTPLQAVAKEAEKDKNKQRIRENNATITGDVPPQLISELTNDYNVSEMFAINYIKSIEKLRRLKKIRITEYNKQKKLHIAKLRELSNAKNNKMMSDVWNKGMKVGHSIKKGISNLRGTREMKGKTDEEKEEIMKKSIGSKTKKMRKGIRNFFGTRKMKNKTDEQKEEIMKKSIGSKAKAFGNKVGNKAKALGSKALSSLSKMSFKRPGCFHPNTLVRLKNNSLIKMKDLSLNAILKDGSRVISVMKISNLNDNNNQNEIFYRIKSGEDNNDILVTGSHLVYDDSIKKYIKVEELKSAVKTKVKSKEVSCLVTSNNKILLGEWTFSDWEEIY